MNRRKSSVTWIVPEPGPYGVSTVATPILLDAGQVPLASASPPQRVASKAGLSVKS